MQRVIAPKYRIFKVPKSYIVKSRFIAGRFTSRVITEGFMQSVVLLT